MFEVKERKGLDIDICFCWWSQ